MKRRNRTEYEYDRYSPPNGKSAPSTSPLNNKNKNPFNVAKVAVLASVFIIGIVVGISLNFSSNSNLASIDSRLEIDRLAPNPELCQQYGASAVVTDMRFFLSMNPFNVFVSQPVMQPGCILRQNNWSLLEQRKLINSEQVKDCKRRMNTFAYTGSIDGSPQINCVYQNDAAGNLFLNRSGTDARPESDSF
ncbi:DUF3172 domain-containing protein [Myxosarcina sp. GI1]|uniref:DUF3172 domain-containing protein n=1 Tax=Myxosarcina sp. GI1 TaxID=1541065 RepID=UPI00055F12F0|nr:DUF3172 domain-containing protein [Myxosarcina sp. GI1]